MVVTPIMDIDFFVPVSTRSQIVQNYKIWNTFSPDAQIVLFLPAWQSEKVQRNSGKWT